MTTAKPSSRSLAPEQNRPEHSPAAAMALVEQAIARLRFGTVLLTIHDGKLVQLDVTERTRFPS